MDFFAQQDQARRRTGQLVVLFVLAVLCIVALINLLTQVLFITLDPPAPGQPLPSLTDRLLSMDSVMIGVAVIAIITLVSLFKWLMLRGGGSAVAESMGGRRLNANTATGDEQRLLNVVEEMAIAAGTPVPPVYLLEHERGINAFAAGHSPKDAVIGVTRGTLETMNRDQLQGVIAHEFSHILNGDMRLNLRLMAVLAGILFISQIGELLMHSSRGRSKESGQLALLGIGLLVLGWIGTLFGKAIKAAVSRQREFLADASAVQFTRNPSGIADALKLIGASQYNSLVENPKATESSHLFFGNIRPKTHWLATHPPLEDRIRAIEPHWDGNYAAVVQQSQRRKEARQPQPEAENRRQSGPSGWMVGAALLAALPTSLKQASHEPEQARELALALLWPEQDYEGLPELHTSVRNNINALHTQLVDLSARQKLTLLELLPPSLNLLSEPQRQVLLEQLKHLWEHQPHRLGRWCVWSLLNHFLTPAPKALPRAERQSASLALIALLAHEGNADEKEQQNAFFRGANALTAYQASWPGAPDWARLSETLPRLVHLPPQDKRRLIRAIELCVAQDGVQTEEEAVLVQLFALLLEAPISLTL
ncbi:M48 family metallopeptidase [Ferrimonas balearica]|uniref:M48 family metallopeptidase n=1 Tax=Ferrimonas balearica TaxID=44012 RepID=UPI001C9960AD|nr:M48 family metallopeptidase [Ferrimonas balearica]MBY5922334.1 M48 family metallopeptidase [Ferrimonas balearica]MBY5994326.1 M48 family metallopeptidase [Ferrimonas balearica]